MQNDHRHMPWLLFVSGYDNIIIGFDIGNPKMTDSSRYYSYLQKMNWVHILHQRVLQSCDMPVQADDAYGQAREFYIPLTMPFGK
jgi:hypothetical protein